MMRGKAIIRRQRDRQRNVNLKSGRDNNGKERKARKAREEEGQCRRDGNGEKRVMESD